MGLFAELFQPVTMVFIAAVAVVSWLLLSRSQRYFAQQRHNEPRGEASLSSMIEKHGHNLDAPDAAAHWEVQMYDTARELSAQLDSKMSTLQALIADADRAAARLEAALSGRPATTPLPAGEKRAGTVADSPIAGTALGVAARKPAPLLARPDQPSGVSLPAGKPISQAESLGLSRGIDLSALEGPSTTNKAAQRAAQDQQREQVYTLADYGFEPGEIASRVGRPIGEVQLILGLREKR